MKTAVKIKLTATSVVTFVLILVWITRGGFEYVAIPKADVFAKYKGMPLPEVLIPVTYLIDYLNTISSAGTPISPTYDNIFHLNYSEDAMKDEVTVVTAFFNLGTISKDGHLIYPSTFERWMKVFSRISNPLVVYLEDDGVINYFKHLRRDFINLTSFVKVSRGQLWAFSHINKITKLFKQGNYPIHHPNTVVPEYPCTVSTKYEFALLTATHNPFRTKYIAWLDIGYFRNLADSTDLTHFKLYKPPEFDETKVAFNQVNEPGKHIPSSEEILLEKLDWVGTGFFLATASVMVTWARQYMLFTECYLSKDLMNSDQQIIYAMFSDNHICPLPLKVYLQIYKGIHRDNANPWFYLGYLSRSEGKKKKMSSINQ